MIRQTIRQSLQEPVIYGLDGNDTKYDKWFAEVQNSVVFVIIAQKVIRLFMVMDAFIEINSNNSLSSLSDETQKHYEEDLNQLRLDLLLNSLLQIIAIVAALAVLMVNTRKEQTYKHKLAKKVLVVLASALDVPIFHTFTN